MNIMMGGQVPMSKVSSETRECLFLLFINNNRLTSKKAMSF